MLYRVAMKILIVIPTLQRGGAERVVSRLSQEWAKTHSVTVAVFDTRQQAYAVGGKMHDISARASTSVLMKIFNIPLRVMRLVGLIRREGPDKIIGFTEYANLPLILAGMLTGSLGRVQVSVRRLPSRNSRLMRLLQRLLYRVPPRVVAVSRGVKQDLADMGIAERRLAFIANPSPTATLVKKSLPPPPPAIPQ